MVSKLSIKLLTPNLVIGLFFILSLFFINDPISHITLVIIVCALVISQLFVSYLFFNQILTKRLIELKNYLGMVVSSDEAPAEPLQDTTNDELAEITNELSQFILVLADVVNIIRQEADMLRQGSTSLSSQVTDSIALVESSADKVNKMADSVEDIAHTSSSLSDSAEKVSETTSAVMLTLVKSTTTSHTSQKTIKAVANEVTNMANELSLLQGESARIGSVLDVIRGIADQTNLLALNAAIEAARAGEQGRGFAVVADEVRALAHRTQESTVEIQSMVEGLQAKSDNAVNSISRGQKLTEDSLNYSAEVVSSLDEIGLSFQDVDKLTSQIASSALAQQNAISFINNNMLDLVSLNEDIKNGFNSVANHADQHQKTSQEVEQTINRICV